MRSQTEKRLRPTAAGVSRRVWAAAVAGALMVIQRSAPPGATSRQTADHVPVDYALAGHPLEPDPGPARLLLKNPAPDRRDLNVS
jgi:hypothetical protein